MRDIAEQASNQDAADQRQLFIFDPVAEDAAEAQHGEGDDVVQQEDAEGGQQRAAREKSAVKDAVFHAERGRAEGSLRDALDALNQAEGKGGHQTPLGAIA